MTTKSQLKARDDQIDQLLSVVSAKNRRLAAAEELAKAAQDALNEMLWLREYTSIKTLDGGDYIEIEQIEPLRAALAEWQEANQ